VTIECQALGHGRFAAAAPFGELRPLGAPVVILVRVRRDGSPSDLREGLAASRREFALYLAAGVLYIAIGVAFPEFLFSWVVAAVYLLVCVVALPALARRLTQ